ILPDLHSKAMFQLGALDLGRALQPRPLAEVVRGRMLAGTTGNAFQALVPLYLAGTVDNPFSQVPRPSLGGLMPGAPEVLKTSEGTNLADPVRQGLAAVLAPAVAQPRVDALFGMPALVLAHRHVAGKAGAASRDVM